MIANLQSSGPIQSSGPSLTHFKPLQRPAPRQRNLGQGAPFDNTIIRDRCIDNTMRTRPKRSYRRQAVRHAWRACEAPKIECESLNIPNARPALVEAPNGGLGAPRKHPPATKKKHTTPPRPLMHPSTHPSGGAVRAGWLELSAPGGCSGRPAIFTRSGRPVILGDDPQTPEPATPPSGHGQSGPEGPRWAGRAPECQELYPGGDSW
jgi:hypothetical protein